MKKISSVIKVAPIIQGAKKQTIRLSEKTLAKTAMANNFLTDIADVYFFIINVIKETFSRNFEFKEFLHIML